MKMILILMVLAAIAVGIGYFTGGSRDFDPNAQGEKARAAITPGMTFAQVLTAAGAPGEWRKIEMVTQKDPFGGGNIKVPTLRARFKYEPGALERRIKDGTLPDGFTAAWVFSRSIAFGVTFDGAGVVLDLEDLRTDADLLDMRDR